MVEELVFHLGDPKAGSTAIQETLAARRFRCKTRSLSYPTKTSHIALAKSFLRPGKADAKAAQMARLSRRLHGSKADVAVVSAEAFSYVEPGALKEALETWLPDFQGRIRLISYVRPHASRLLSEFTERTKQGVFDGTLEEMHAFLKGKQTLVYAPRFSEWRATFGAAFELRPMIRERLKDRDVVADFLDFALRGADVSLRAESTRNAALSLADLAVLREIQRLARQSEVKKPVRIALGWHLSRKFAETPSATGAERLRLHKALAEEVLETYRGDAAALDAMCFDGQPMESALLASRTEAVEAPQETEAAALFDEDHLRLVRLWADFALVLMKDNPESALRSFRRDHIGALGLDDDRPTPHTPKQADALGKRLLRRVRSDLSRLNGRLRA